ncbi:MAG: putative toxin-antitoxin system toxin component, PIN family, partial [Chloroflexota bacterium]
PILRELEIVFQKPYFRSRAPASLIELMVEEIRLNSSLVTIDIHVAGVASHQEDDLILATAISGNADYLVTGDRDLLDLDRFHSTRIVTPRDFLDILSGADND